MMLFKKLALQIEWRIQAKRAIKQLLSIPKGPFFRGEFAVRYEDCSDDDKRYLCAYDEMLGELKAIRLYDYDRYKKNFVKYITSNEKFRAEAARELLDNEFEDDKGDIEKLLILK